MADAPLDVHLFSALLFFGVGLVICGAGLAVARILRPNRPSADKMTAYECGERPVGPGQFRLNIRFYMMALIFIIFDVELVAILPTAVVFRSWLFDNNACSQAAHIAGTTACGGFAFAEIFIFVAILAIGLIYVWRKGDIDWVKDIPDTPAARRP